MLPFSAPDCIRWVTQGVGGRGSQENIPWEMGLPTSSIKGWSGTEQMELCGLHLPICILLSGSDTIKFLDLIIWTDNILKIQGKYWEKVKPAVVMHKQ